MAVERLTVSLEPELAAAVREAADSDAQNTSAWLAEAAQNRLATRGLAEAVAQWERANGAFTTEELEVARGRLSQ